MTSVDDAITDRLRAQMTAYTALDVSRSDLLEQVQTGLRRRRRRHLTGVAALALVATGAAALLLPGRSTEPDRLATPPGSDATLSLQPFGGPAAASFSVEDDGTTTRVEQVHLPALLRNDGQRSLTLESFAIPGTDLRTAFDDRVVVPGGRQPLSFTRTVDCTTPNPGLPDSPRIVVSLADGRSVVLDLPESVVSTYREFDACAPLPKAPTGAPSG